MDKISMKNVISIYASHDASVCVMTSDGKFRVFEAERLLKKRFASLIANESYKDTYDKLKNMITKECGVDSFDTCYYLHLTEKHKLYLKEIFKIKEFKETYHHESHAACSFYQSTFDEALVISYDGGGYDGEEDMMGFFNIYHVKRGQPIERIYRTNLDLGSAYGLMGMPISEIHKDKTKGGDFLTFAGKLMGLVAYGNVIKKWQKPLEKFYRHDSHNVGAKKAFYDNLTKRLYEHVNISSFSKQKSYDLAATSQWVFEKIFFKETDGYFGKHTGLPICLAGGCALNVVLNQKIKERYADREIFIPPNPSDCGLSFGMIALHEMPQQAVDLTYAGMSILDIDELPAYVKKYNARKIELAELACLLYKGKIIGVMHGNSEHGPRALGNRSILCNPGIEHMKDTLNAKVKFREWFRPFAPVVRAESVSRYFDFKGETRYMSYSPKVKPLWTHYLSAIVHKDGTARVQTITEEQNKFLYDILGEFKALSGYDVLINTSFNIRGNPILTTVKDAIEVLEETEIDAVLINGYLFDSKMKSKLLSESLPKPEPYSKMLKLIF